MRITANFYYITINTICDTSKPTYLFATVAGQLWRYICKIQKQEKLLLYVLQRQRGPEALYNSCFLKFQKKNKELHCRCLLFPVNFVKLFRTAVLQKLLEHSVRNILENFQGNYHGEVICFLKSFLEVLDQTF